MVCEWRVCENSVGCVCVCVCVWCVLCGVNTVCESVCVYACVCVCMWCVCVEHCV